MSEFHVVYRHFAQNGELLYVGLSSFKRMGDHRRDSFWFSEIDHITVEHFESREDAAEAEKVAIQLEDPLHNTVRYEVTGCRSSDKGPSMQGVNNMPEESQNEAAGVGAEAARERIREARSRGIDIMGPDWL